MDQGRNAGLRVWPLAIRNVCGAALVAEEARTGVSKPALISVTTASKPSRLMKLDSISRALTKLTDPCAVRSRERDAPALRITSKTFSQGVASFRACTKDKIPVLKLSWGAQKGVTRIYDYIAGVVPYSLAN